MLHTQASVGFLSRHNHVQTVLPRQAEPKTEMIKLLNGHWIDILKTLPDNSVHCVITSPPYYGLRSYLPANHPMKYLELGNESTPFDYISKLAYGFEEVRRVLRKDGTLWLNLGDTYATAAFKWGGSQGHLACKQNTNRGSKRAVKKDLRDFKYKDLMGIPWRVAIALQDNGWHLRLDNIWQKPNAMPESVPDRCNRVHEYFFHFSKSAKYFFDAHAIKEPSAGTAHSRGTGVNPKANGPNSRMIRERTEPGKTNKPNPSLWNNCRQNASFSAAVTQPVLMRNKRSVWTVAIAPYRDAHYATFPPQLITPAILAGTSAKGVCANCGAQWRRVLKKAKSGKTDYRGKYSSEKESNGTNLQRSLKAARAQGGDHDNPFPQAQTVGWEPTCNCPDPWPIPATILDPFAGSFTVGMVARSLGRSAIGIELNPEYIEQGECRSNVTPSLPLAV